jgi:serine/threonine-protein kinase RsbW
MSLDAVSREIKLTLPMAPDMEIEASETATAMARAMEMSADKIDEIRMAVVEACINALEHSRSSERHVHLTFQMVGRPVAETLRITVEDHGIGFDPDGVREPIIEEKISAQRKRGWGLKIIRGLMDDVEISSGVDGTTLVMSKSR